MRRVDLVNLLAIEGRAKQIVRVIVVIIGVLSLLKYVAVFELASRAAKSAFVISKAHDLPHTRSGASWRMPFHSTQNVGLSAIRIAPDGILRNLMNTMALGF